MRYPILSLPLILCWCVLISGCKEKVTDIDPTTYESKGIMPLKVGNKWWYRVTTYDTNGTYKSDYPDSLGIYDVVSIGGEIWYEYMGSSLGSLYGIYYLNRADGLWRIDRPIADSALIAKYPAQQNDTFDTERNITGFPGPIDTTITNWIVDDLAATIPVTKGTFTCYHYKAQIRNAQGRLFTLEERKRRRDAEVHYYYAPNIGMVLHEIWDVTPGGRIYKRYQKELVDYILK